MTRLILVLFAAVSLNCLTPATAFAQSEQDFEIAISNETSREQLVEIRTQLAEQGLTFRYHPSFNSDRILTGIKFTVTDEAGFTGTHNSDNLMNGEVVKIRRTIVDGEASYCLGSCD